MSEIDTECGSCGESPENECPASGRPCGHHCNCVWENNLCHWCGTEFGESSEPPLTAIGYIDHNGRRHFVYTAAEMWDIYDEAPFLFTTQFRPFVDRVPPRPGTAT